MGNWGYIGLSNSFFWCYRIFFSMGPSRLLGSKIVTGVPEALPFIGNFVVELLRGSVSVGQSTLTRFYSLHTFVLPVLTATFMVCFKIKVP